MSTQGRKPIPKSQKDISISQQTAYSNEKGNPNAAIPSPKNRALQTSFKKI